MSINEIWHKSILNTEANSKLGDMAAKIAIQHFEHRYATMLFYNSTLYFSVELFLHMFNYNIVLNRETINPRLIKIVKQYVLFVSDVTDLEHLLDTLRELEAKNINKFIIVCQSHVSDSCDEEDMTELLWKNNIVNVVIIKSDGEQALGYTYYPISDGLCNNVKPIKLIWSDHNQYFKTAHGSVFGMKLKSLSFCPLFVSTFIQYPFMSIVNGTPVGADGDLLGIIAYSLNATLKVMTPHRGNGWGFLQSNGTWAGSLADIYDGLANFSMTSAVLTLTRVSTFHLSRSYHVSHVSWVTHPAPLQNAALKLLYPFEKSTRIALAVSYMVVVLGAFIVKSDKCSSTFGKIQNTKYSRSVVFYSWMICMGQAVMKLPTKSALLQMMFSWIYYCFIIRTVYQVYLISSLKGQFYEDQFNTIEDALTANYEFGGGSALRDYYIDNPAIYDKWINIEASDLKPIVLNISKGQKFVLAMNRDTANMIIKRHKVKLHILRQDLVSSPAVLFFKKYSPLAEPINFILDRLVAAGFSDKFHKKYTKDYTKSLSDNKQDPLKIVHFTACYVVLITGWSLSFVFFLLEFYFGKIHKHSMCSA